MHRDVATWRLSTADPGVGAECKIIHVDGPICWAGTY